MSFYSSRIVSVQIFFPFPLKPVVGGRLRLCGQFSCRTSEETSLVIHKVVVEYTYVRVFHWHVGLRKVSDSVKLSLRTAYTLILGKFTLKLTTLFLGENHLV